MPGLLTAPRACLRGHGPMAEQPGTFALMGVSASRPNALRAAVTLNMLMPQTYTTDGRMYALKVWKCATCGAIELVDEA